MTKTYVLKTYMPLSIETTIDWNVPKRELLGQFLLT